MYPESVTSNAEKVYNVFAEDLITMTDRNAEFCKLCGMEVINRYLLPKFLNGEDLLIDEDDVNKLFSMCIGNISIESLKEKGLIDTIEDEKGEEVIFLTKKGKELKNK